MAYNGTDPITLAAQARAVLQGLHKQNDVVVRFKTDESGYEEDALDDLDREAPGHFKPDKNILTLNLDRLVKGKRITALESLEDFRKYPVLAGVAAHESGHARWSRWDALPESIPNPDFDATAEEGTYEAIETFPVSTKGKLFELASLLEEPRIERLGSGTFTKTWRKAMQFSAGHLVLEGIDEQDENGVSPLDAAVGMAIMVGGRVTAGTLGASYESRKMVKTVLESAQKIIETALPDVEDPFHQIMGIVNTEIFNNDHDDAVIHLEAARQILRIVHKDEEQDPDENGEGEEDEEGEGEGAGVGGSAEMAAALSAMADAMKEQVDALGESVAEMVRSEEEHPEEKGGGGYGSTLYKNPLAPQIAYYEQPNANDRALYKRALEWMEKQISPTITESEFGQWLPVGGARLNVRSYLRDDMAGHRGAQRSDWDRVSETVKSAPPVKVGIMLDGSGSMRSMARPSASIAWAASNAAAMLPESRTVSVVYGDAAQVTQAPGHVAARQIAVSETDGSTEEFIDAAQMVEDALWLNEPLEEGERTNVLIIIISDLVYGGHNDRLNERQIEGFHRITKEWAEKGYKVVVVGASEHRATAFAKSRGVEATPTFELVKPEDLFR